MTMSPYSDEDKTLTYNIARVTAIVTLPKNQCTSDAYYFFLYNDELILLDTAETGSNNTERHGRKLEITFSGTRIWIPGKYFLLMRNSSYQVFRFDITLDDNATFTATEPQQCTLLSMEDLLSSPLFIQDNIWRFLSEYPGTRQFRQKVIERLRLTKMNEYRNHLAELGNVEASNNFIIDSRGYSKMANVLRHFNVVVKMGVHLQWVDCSTLYDPTLNNPYEKLNELFEDKSQDSDPLNSTPTMYVLQNISALLENGGKQILKKLKQQTSNFIVVGTRQETDSLMEQFPSLRSLFPADNHLSIEPFTIKEIILRFTDCVTDHNLYLSPATIDEVCHKLVEAYTQGVVAQWTLEDIDSFVVNSIQPGYCRRLTATMQSGFLDFDDVEVMPQDVDYRPLTERATTCDELFGELNTMIGLADIKNSIKTIANNIRLFTERQQLGLHNGAMTPHHAIFMGNPGTGKTTVARMLGKIYHSMGLLSHGEVICVDRTRIVGRFIGDTEDNMKQILEEARGNVLFVDEAYTLYSNESCNDFGRRAVECLLSVLTQKDPDMLVIFAGYQEQMDRLMSMNPGLLSRFPYKFVFSDYTTEELTQIAHALLKKDDYLLTAEADKLLRDAISEAKGQKSKKFGNARWVEQFVGNGVIPAMADRLASAPHAYTREVYQRIEASDIRQACERLNPKAIELKPHRQVGFSA